MNVCYTPSAQCDDAQDARQLFEVVSLLCSIFFGIPLGLVTLRMFDRLSDAVGRTAYLQAGLQSDVVFGLILAACTFIPIVYTYIRYRRKMELEE